jgi:hypothetical protein
MDMNTALQVATVGAVHQKPGKNDDWAYRVANTLAAPVDMNTETVKLQLVRDGVDYYFYVNGALALAGHDLTDENGAAGFFSFGTELTLTDYSVVTEGDAFAQILTQAKADGQNYDAQKDLILQEKNGILTDVADTEQMAAAMRKMLSDPQLRLSCAEHALELNEQLQVDRIVGHWQECLRSV